MPSRGLILSMTSEEMFAAVPENVGRAVVKESGVVVMDADACGAVTTMLVVHEFVPPLFITRNVYIYVPRVFPAIFSNAFAAIPFEV
jgi:hypothetical protein